MGKAQLDANDIEETADAEHIPNKNKFSSQNTGAMHACGHDGHMATGLTVAEILASLKSELNGTIKLIFQPAEEGVRGARAMVEKGVVDDVDYMIGAHFGFQMKKTGMIACSVNGFLATSKYDARFKGVPAHAGAFPETGKNALLAACCAALNLHAISRHSKGASRINVGRMEAGSGRNIIADKAFLQLETRGASSEINGYMSKEAKRILEAAALMYDVKLDLKQTGGAAGANSSEKLGSFIEATARELNIFSKVVGKCEFGASEDYSYFMERVQAHGGQAAYMMIGADLAAGHHDNHFTFDEKALPRAVKIIAATAAGLLAKEK